MDNNLADLHLHTDRSDGHCSPQMLVERCHELGLAAISVVDHDDVSAYDDILETARKFEIEVITGVEFSASWKGFDLHILGYGFDVGNSELRHYLNVLRKERLKRAEIITEKLAEMGMPIAFQAVIQKAGCGSVGRPHIAEVLVEQGYVASFQEAFNKFLGDNKPANVMNLSTNAVRALELVQNAGGICVVAHPALLPNGIQLDGLIELGFQGIETIHPKHKNAKTEYYRSIALRYGLIETGGSDYHGDCHKADSLGKYCIPYQTVERIKSLTQRPTNQLL